VKYRTLLLAERRSAAAVVGGHSVTVGKTVDRAGSSEPPGPNRCKTPGKETPFWQLYCRLARAATTRSALGSVSVNHDVVVSVGAGCGPFRSEEALVVMLWWLWWWLMWWLLLCSYWGSQWWW
jgi:hypothetical protein